MTPKGYAACITGEILDRFQQKPYRLLPPSRLGLCIEECPIDVAQVAQQPSALSERKQNVGIPGAVQSQRLVQIPVATAGIEPRGVDAEQHPR